jgi:hypothetical protein
LKRVDRVREQKRKLRESFDRYANRIEEDEVVEKSGDEASRNGGKEMKKLDEIIRKSLRMSKEGRI